MIPAPKGAYWGTNEATRHFTSQGRLGGSTTADASAVSAAGTGCGQPLFYAISRPLEALKCQAKSSSFGRPKSIVNATSRSKGRRGNDAYGVREHLTEAEMDKLLAALKGNRHGHRGLADRSGLRGCKDLTDCESLAEVLRSPLAGEFTLDTGRLVD